MLIKSIAWPATLSVSVTLGHSLYERGKFAASPHVFLVRGEALNRTNGDERKCALIALMNDWLRSGWPVAMHLEQHSKVDSILSECFNKFSSGGGGSRCVRVSQPRRRMIQVQCGLTSRD